MKELYDDLSFRVSKLTTRLYSTSFSMGIYFLDNQMRNAIYSIYGFVRIADEIVDSFAGYDKERLIEKFELETFEAIKSRISLNPVLNSFQHTVYEFNISCDLIRAFLRSMQMDLEKVDYTSEEFEQYIYGSSEVVGLMCLHIFTEGRKEMYEELKPYAMKLGSAFQKINFLRDMKDDYYILGRRYFPHINISHFTNECKKQIEQDIKHDFEIALKGIKMLPRSSKLGVYLAYVTYLSLFKKIKRLPASHILKNRVRINNGKKLRLMLNTLFYVKMNWV